MLLLRETRRFGFWVFRFWDYFLVKRAISSSCSKGRKAGASKMERIKFDQKVNGELWIVENTRGVSCCAPNRWPNEWGKFEFSNSNQLKESNKNNSNSNFNIYINNNSGFRRIPICCSLWFEVMLNNNQLALFLACCVISALNQNNNNNQIDNTGTNLPSRNSRSFQLSASFGSFKTRSSSSSSRKLVLLKAMIDRPCSAELLLKYSLSLSFFLLAQQAFIFNPEL